MPPSRKQTALRVPIVPILLVVLIGIPLAEIAVFIAVGDRIGVGWTLALILLTAVIGAAVMRQQGFAVVRRAQQQLDQGTAPVLEVFEGLCLLLGGVLLLTPGFITDTLGALLMVPALRHLLYRRVRHHLEVRVGGQSAGGPRPGRRAPPTIDAEFEEVPPETPDAGPGEQDQRRMPPPRGGWGRGA
jgi:UPF0716 protein FxsA